METWATAIGGFASILIGWVLPMIAPTLPHWVQIAVLCLGGGLLLISVVLGLLAKRSKRDKSGISVKMGNRNKIGHIGNDYGGRER